MCLMWFNNALVYTVSCDSYDNLESQLSENKLKPCPPHSRFIFGFLETINHLMTHQVDNSYFFTLGKEERMLQRSVINQALVQKSNDFEKNQGRPLKRAERAHLKEELEFELLPKAFCVQKKLSAFIDVSTNRLIINTSSSNQGTQLCSLLRKALPSLEVKPLEISSCLGTNFTMWLDNPNLLPKQFTLAPNCLLTSPDDEKKKFNCKGYELPSDEVCSLIEKGLTATEISLIWNERIQFTINTDFVFKRIKCVDYLIDEISELNQLDDELEKIDASYCLLSGELRQLINDVVNLFEKKKNTQNELEALSI